MKKILAIAFTAVLAVSCTTKKPLYSWGDYGDATYSYLKDSDEDAIEDLLKNYKDMIKNQNGTRKTVPPGIYADYGYLLMQEGRTEEGRRMFKKEIELYPESRIFIDRILKMLEQ